MKGLEEMDRVLDRRDVCQLLGISEATFSTQSRDKGFPAPFKWSPQTEARWLYSEVVDFIANSKKKGAGA